MAPEAGLDAARSRFLGFLLHEKRAAVAAWRLSCVQPGRTCPRPAFASGWPYAVIAAAALGLAVWTKVHPLVILLGGSVGGAVYGLLRGIEPL